jgi:23S rRNA pseudouridine1911/1915/1917 synthase
MPQPRTVETRVEDATEAGARLDVFLTAKLGHFTRSQWKIRVTGVMVNGSPARMSRIMRVGDSISLTYADPPPLDLLAEDIPLSVIFENDEVIVIDKAQGMVVHPGSGNHTGTLVNAILFRYAGLSAGFGAENPRPGIVHRLDKETSGIMIVAKNGGAHEELATQFRDRTVRKRYVALVAGVPPAPEGSIDMRLVRDPRNRQRFTCTPAGGRSALTRYKVQRTYSAQGRRYAVVLLAPRTGRTHQLRVHLRHIGTPIVGDPLYGKKDDINPAATLMLHARSLTIRLPGETEARTFSAPLPQRFREAVRLIQSFSPSKGL